MKSNITSRYFVVNLKKFSLVGPSVYLYITDMTKTNLTTMFTDDTVIMASTTIIWIAMKTFEFHFRKPN